MVYTPFLLVFHITGRCNLQCAYCYASAYDRTDLKIEVVQDVLSQAAELGTRHVILSGGEPLLHPAFYEFAEYANKLPLKVHMTSNGTMIDTIAAENLKSSGMPSSSVTETDVGGYIPILKSFCLSCSNSILHSTIEISV